MIQYDQVRDKRIAVLLSGGVDSSVVVCELARHGLHPDCFYIKIGPEEQEEWNCSSEEDLEMATAVAARYGCRLQVVDCHREYWDQVTRYTMEKVKAGFTPNPDVMCNRLIKFGAFDEKMGHDYDLIATGHYAQTEWIAGRKWLTTSPDPVKDQTDFLAQIYDWQLRKALFPIGHMMKEEVRAIAEREHLLNARRKDSQGICFLGQIDYNEYLRRYLGEQPGDIIEMETGRRIGGHRGLWFHTIGQRKGLGLGGGPWFVIRKDVEHNVLYVSHGYDPETAYKQDFRVHDLHWLTAAPEAAADLVGHNETGQADPSSSLSNSSAHPLIPSSSHPFIPSSSSSNSSLHPLISSSPHPFIPSSSSSSNWIPITFKIRHTPEFHRGYIEPLTAAAVPAVDTTGAECGETAFPTAGYHEAVIHSADKIHGVAPGQFCVIYDRDHHRCFGSAEITL